MSVMKVRANTEDIKTSVLTARAQRLTFHCSSQRNIVKSE